MGSVKRIEMGALEIKNREVWKTMHFGKERHHRKL